MTLLALMYSQILIVNTKGLTHNISDILEVSSYHLNTLSQWDSKPRINFVLRDMKDARKIDARGNFLHFKNSKDIQQWNAIKKIVNSYDETLLESYKCLDQETNKYLSQALADFWLKVSNQYNPKIIDEESQLIKLAKDKIGEAVEKILEENKDKTSKDFEKIFSKSKRDELFDIEWKKIEENHQAFMLSMIIETKKLEEHAIEDRTSKISDENKPREKFNQRFWNTLVKPATLVKSDPLDDLQFLE
ncbi:23896_t:CDS:2, partial [Racocetra persica]